MGTSKFYANLTGSAAPVSMFCKPGDDKCFRIAIDCTAETEAAQRLVLCTTATTLGAIAHGCGKVAADNVCSATTADTTNTSGGSGYTAAGIEGLKITTQVSGICCDGKTTNDCNNTIDCWFGVVVAG